MQPSPRPAALRRPLDAATVFAHVYQRWFDDARGLTEENKRHARSVVGAYVADVLTLWDESTRDYLAGAPLILRLEACDVTAFVMREPHIALSFEGIETGAPTALFGSTFRWESFRPCSYAIGRRLTDLVFSTDENDLLVEVEAVLDDGGLLLLGNRALWSLPRAV